MNEIAAWTNGEQCERHFLAYCADCRDMAHLRRTASGEVAYKADCAVQTFMELTGADYTEALAHMTQHGFAPGGGTPADKISEAFEAVGYQVREVTREVRYEDLRFAANRSFYVVGWKGKKCHAWSVAEGKTRRAFRPPFKYQVYEVSV